MAFYEVIFGLEQSDICGLTGDMRTAVEFQMCVSIADLGPWKYWNFKTPRNRNSLGYAQVMCGEYVVETIHIQHINQEILHWRDIAFGINASIGCYAKALAILIDNGMLQANNVRTRQRYTSVRFRFYPGVLANVVLRWETGEPLCDDVISEPNEDQAKPPQPKNHQHSPESRPAPIQGDGDDPTVTDGDDYEDEDDRPPYAELLPATGQWYGIYTAKNINNSCQQYSDEYALPGATDGTISPVLIPGATGQCPGTQDGVVMWNGIQVDAPQEYVTYTFEFRET